MLDMSEPRLVLVVIAAIAIYKERGSGPAINYLKNRGFQSQAAIDVIALYDQYVDVINFELLEKELLDKKTT